MSKQIFMAIFIDNMKTLDIQLLLICFEWKIPFLIRLLLYELNLNPDIWDIIPFARVYRILKGTRENGDSELVTEYLYTCWTNINKYFRAVHLWEITCQSTRLPKELDIFVFELNIHNFRCLSP